MDNPRKLTSEQLEAQRRIVNAPRQSDAVQAAHGRIDDHMAALEAELAAEKVGGKALRNAYCMGRDAYAAEKQAREEAEAQRQYYINILYDVCGWIDKMLNRHVSKGTGTVCGQLAYPNNGVQRGLQEVEANLACEKQAREKAEAGLHDCQMTPDAAQRHIKTAEVERDRLRELLNLATNRIFHGPWCPQHNNGSGGCTCGTAELRRDIRKALAAKEPDHA